jgi:hypothetical protein
MTIRQVPTAPPRKLRHSYGEHIAALDVADGWLAVPAEEIGGNSKSKKQTAIHAACQRAGLRIETRTDGAEIFVRKQIKRGNHA